MTLGLLAAFLASLTWALGVNVYSDLSLKYPASTINFNRALVAAPMFVVASLIYEILQGPELRFQWNFPASNIIWLLVSSVASYAVGDLLFFKSSQSSLRVTGALAIASIYPIWSALFGSLFFNQNIERWGVLGLLLVVGGSIGVILSSQEKTMKNSSNSFASATGLAIGVSLLWALNTFAVGQVVGQDAFSANATRLSFAIVLCPLFGRLILGPTSLLISKKDFLKALPVFMFEGFGGSFFYVYGLSHSSLAMGAVLTSLAPVLSVPIYYLRHRELPSRVKLLSIVIVVLGLWLMLAL